MNDSTPSSPNAESSVPRGSSPAERRIIPPDVLLQAYAQGYFPMGFEGDVQWYSPRLRGIIPVDERFHIPHGLKRTLRKKPFRVQMDAAFATVLHKCAEREETWIDQIIYDSYLALHHLGHAHSVECWDEEGLQGGLYGVAMGRAFFGESMFSRKTDASKVALVHLVHWMREQGYTLLDTQWMTDHLRQFGGLEIPRRQYLQLLAEALDGASPHEQRDV